jgi:hypothetical protein
MSSASIILLVFGMWIVKRLPVDVSDSLGEILRAISRMSGSDAAPFFLIERFDSLERRTLKNEFDHF